MYANSYSALFQRLFQQFYRAFREFAAVAVSEPKTRLQLNPCSAVHPDKPRASRKDLFQAFNGRERENLQQRFSEEIEEKENKKIK